MKLEELLKTGRGIMGYGPHTVGVFETDKHTHCHLLSLLRISNIHHQRTLVT